MYDLSYRGIHRITQLPITEGLSKPDIELKKFMSDPTIYEDDPRLPNFNKAWHEMGSRLWLPHIGDSWTEYRAPQPGSNVVIRAFREYPELFREFLDLSSNPAVREDRPYYSEDDLKKVMGYAQRAYDMQWGKTDAPFTDEDIIFALEHFPYTYTKRIIETDGSALYLRPECSYTYGNVVVNQWLVHNSTNAHMIWETGFKYGAPINKLVNTSYTKKEESETSEYAFAFPIDEAPEPRTSIDDADEEDEEEEKEEDPDDIEYMDEEERKFRGKAADKFFKLRYGGNGCQSGSIVFVASGNQMFHHGDHEHQVMFNKNEPAGCFLITRFPLSSYMPKFKIPNHIRSIYRWTNHGIWFIYGNDKNRPLFMSKNYMDCLNWIKKNGATYASAMKRWKPGNVSPKKFESYLGTLPKSPLTEAVTALYEGLTKPDLNLGQCYSHRP